VKCSCWFSMTALPSHMSKKNSKKSTKLPRRPYNVTYRYIHPTNSDTASDTCTTAQKRSDGNRSSIFDDACHQGPVDLGSERHQRTSSPGLLSRMTSNALGTPVY
jgi:hypothetical protein